MGKLKVFSGKEVCQILEVHGFEKVRQRGSHVIMQKQMPDNTVTVPVPDHKEVRAGTLTECPWSQSLYTPKKEQVSLEVLSLPIYSELDNDEVDMVVEAVRKFHT